MIRKLLVACLAVVLLAGMGTVAWAQTNCTTNIDRHSGTSGFTVQVDIEPDSGRTLGWATSGGTNYLASQSFYVPKGADIYLAVGATDTSYQENTDTLKFSIQKWVSDGGASHTGSEWVAAYSTAFIRAGSTFPVTKFIPADTVSAGVYPVAGLCRLALISGRVSVAVPDTLDGVWKFNAMLEVTR